MTTREQLETEASELYPLPPSTFTETSSYDERRAHVRAKTISAEQVEAAAYSHDPAPWDEPFLVDIQRFFNEQGSPVEKRKAQARTTASAALRAAGFYVEEATDD